MFITTTLGIKAIGMPESGPALCTEHNVRSKSIEMTQPGLKELIDPVGRQTKDWPFQDVAP